MAKTLQFDDFAPQQNPNCAACEELLTDALDGLLSPADQAFFELHLDGCVPCMEKFAQAQRGAAWLELLKTHRPEPSAALMERILAQTTGQVVSSHNEFPAEIPAAITPLPANVLPFIPRQAGVSRFTRFTRLAMEPRLAMTAAMAFFSIALTLNLTGVRFDQIHTADLKPSNLKRSYYEAKASAVRYSDNLRVVRVLESRVDDLRQAILAQLGASGSLADTGSLNNLRQQETITATLSALSAAANASAEALPHELILLDLHTALRALDSLTGATTPDDILARIFSTFCIGK